MLCLVILEIEDLVKSYPEVRAVNQVSLRIEQGMCFGLLGPNGAGKTTTLEMIEGITQPTSGRVLYKGAPSGPLFKQEAGFLFQSTALQDYLTVKETLTLFSRLYHKTANIEEIIETCNLGPLLSRDNRKLSGGQRQRMLLAIALVNDPEIIFLDEPTTGLDPQARRNFWELLESIKRRRKTIVLTTHYMEEAERLCDRVAIMDQGKIIAEDAPSVLLRTHFSDVVLEIPQADLNGASIDELDVQQLDTQVVLHTQNLHDTLVLLNQKGVNLSRVQIRNRNLEDLFLKLTGKDLRT